MKQNQVWRMRWFLVIVTLIWLISAMIIPFVSFYVTKDRYSLTLFGTLAPPASILYWIVKCLFRVDKEL